MDAPFCTYELKETVTRTIKIPNKNTPLSPIEAESLRQEGENIGIMLDCLPSITCLDIDNAHDKNNRIKSSVVYILNVCEKAGGIIERSQSGKGYHVFLSGNKPDHTQTRAKLNDGAMLECYDSYSPQFIALSFDLITHRFKNLSQFYDLLMQLDTGDSVERISSEYLYKQKVTPQDFKQHDLTDSEVLKIAANSKHGAQFKQLHYDGDTFGFDSDSEADYALMRQYAYFCACNAAQMKRLALSSALYRKKWDKGYLNRTITNAISNTNKVYDPSFSANTKKDSVIKLNTTGISFTSQTEITSSIKNCSHKFLNNLPPAIAEFLSKSRPLPILQQQAAEYAHQIVKKRGYKTEQELYSDIYSTASYMYKEEVQNLYSFLQLNVNTTNVDKRYLDASDAVINMGDTLLVRSHMNTGKTFAVMRENIRKLLEKKPHAKILALTGRQVLAENIALQTNLNYYVDVKGLETAQEKKQASYQLSMCINSIGMVDLSIDYDLIIIDESELTLSHILGATIADNDRKRTLQSLYTLLGQANNVICLDAFISRVTHDVMQNAGRKNIRLLNNTYNPWSNVQVNWHTDDTNLLDTTNKLINKDESVFIFCNTKKGAKARAKYYSNQYPKKKVLAIHADNVKEDEQQSCIQDSNLLKNYDIVIASPTIEAGFSIELEQFTNVVGFFVHTKEGTGAALSSLQQLGRSRKAQNWHIWAEIKHYDYTRNYDDLLTEYVISNNFLTKNIKGNRLDAEFQIDNLAHLNASVKSWENTQRAALAFTLYTFISDYMDMPVNINGVKGKKETKDNLIDAANEVTAQEANDLIQADDIDETQLNELRGKQSTTGITHAESLSMKKYDLNSMLPPELLKEYNLADFAEIYLKGYMKKIRRIEQLTCDKDTALKYAALRVDGGFKISDDGQSKNIDPYPVTEYAKKNTLLYRSFMGFALEAVGYDVSRLKDHGIEDEQIKKISFTSEQIMQSNWHKFMLNNWQAVNLLGICSHINSIKTLSQPRVIIRIFSGIFNNLHIPLQSERKRVPSNSSFLYKSHKKDGTEKNTSTVPIDLHGGNAVGKQGVRIRVYSVDMDRFKDDIKSELLYAVLDARFKAGVNWMTEFCSDKELHTYADKIEDLTPAQQEALKAVCQEMDYEDAKKECEDIFQGFTLDYKYYARACNSFMFDYDEMDTPAFKLSHASN